MVVRSYTEQCPMRGLIVTVHALQPTAIPSMLFVASILVHESYAYPNTTYDPGYRSYESLLLSIETSNYRCMESLSTFQNQSRDK